MNVKSTALCLALLLGLGLKAGEYTYYTYEGLYYLYLKPVVLKKKSAPIIAKNHYNKWQRFNKSNKGTNRTSCSVQRYN